MRKIEIYEGSGSGWVLDRFNHLDLILLRYNLLRWSSYIKGIPKKFSEGYVNIQNRDDEKCFLWAVLAHLHSVTDQRKGNPERVTHYTQYENELNMTGIQYPVQISQITKFEGQNPTISISLFALTEDDKKDIYPVRIPSEPWETT